MKIRWTAILGILLALMIGCSTEARGPRCSLENGVEVVDNGSGIYEVEGQPRALSLEEEFRIDLEDPQYAELGLTRLAGLDVDSKGRIYLFQAIPNPGNLVYQFDDRGGFVRSFCAVGQGPGEVQNPRFGRITAADEIPVENFQGPTRTIHLFDGEGRLRRTTTGPRANMIGGTTFLPNGRMLARYLKVTDQGLVGDLAAGLFDPDGHKIVDMATVPGFGQGADIGATMKSMILCAASSSSIFAGAMGHDWIDVFDFQGTRVRTIRARFPEVAVPAGYWEEFKSQYRDMAASIEAQYESKTWPSRFPMCQALFTDDRDRLYVAAFERDERGMTVCDVFTPEGVRFLRTGIGYMDFYWPLLGLIGLDPVIRNDRLHCVREKPGGFFEVIVYRMIWS